MTDRIQNLIVRAYEESDIPEITLLYNQRSVAAGTLQIPLMSTRERTERFRATTEIRQIVAELDGKVIGHAGLNCFRGRRAHVAQVGMGVDEEFQGRGVGSALMEALLDLADNWYNIARVELTVYADNAAAIALYKKYGFVEEGRHPAYAFREGAYTEALSMARLRFHQEEIRRF